ncbi:hypothetical protein [Saccharibacillus sp. JS10]|uniref:hypothetical protein n=1 Tax=Saccharibacillus sp. JS10 TaxID=2950552 RepID=UPI00210C0D3D|nr:hypothetical protein [Saccharibacillus sp. JS10]MCQ4087526.1 hypothetical protein [Saccharibacillus sp. JS10]
MEKVALNKADSGNWAIDYKPSMIVNPDLVRPMPQNDHSKVVTSKSETQLDQDPTKEKELMSDADRKKREEEWIQKMTEERLAQQKLLQTFYAEKARVDMAPSQIKDAMRALAERSIEQQIVRDGSSMKVEWKSELHQVSVEISETAYDKRNDLLSAKKDLVESQSSPK